MPSTFRIPKAPVTGLYGKVLTIYARRTYGEVPDSALGYSDVCELPPAVPSTA